MDKKVVIGITVALLLIGAIIIVYGGTQIVSEEKVDANKERFDDGYYHYDGSSILESTRKRISHQSNFELPTLPEGGNEVILGIIFIAGGIMLYRERKKFLTSTT